MSTANIVNYIVEIVPVGEQGEPGVGIAVGGTTGKVLRKNSNASYDTYWSNGSGAIDSVNGQVGIVVLDADDVGAYSNTNPNGYTNISQVQAVANVVSVNGQTGIVVLDADDVGAYSNTNPNGYQNVSQVVSYANVVSVNGYSGVVVLDADDVGAYSNTNPNGYINISQVSTVGNVVSVNGQSGIVVLDADDVGAYSNTNPSNFVNASGAASAAPVQSVTGTLVSGTSADPVINIPTLEQVGAYSNTNPAGYQNISQVQAYANVISVNGQSGIAVLGLDDLSNVNVSVANTGDVLKYNATTNTWSAGVGGGAVDSVNGQTGVVILNMDDINDVQATNATEGQYLIYNATASAWQAKSVSAGGVQSVSGDGVDNTDPQNPVISFPTLDEIGAYSNTNPNGYQNVSQVVAYANVVSVNGQSGIVVLDADDVGAYSNTNPAGYQNVSQVVAYANVVSVNGYSGVVVLDADDVGAYSNTNPNGYQNVTQVVSYANVINVNGQSGVVNVYPGGTTNQILAKNSSTNGDASWTSNINIDTATFSTTVNATPGIAKLSWNYEEKTLEFGKTADTVLQIGQETLYPLVYNADSITLTRGTVVMVDPTQPAQGNKLRIKRMVADGTLPAKLIVGLVTESIAAGADGFVTWFGLLRNISLSAKQPGGETWAEGDILYCDPSVAGGLTKVEPIAPNLKLSTCAIVSIDGNNVNVHVRPWLSDDLKDLHDVNVLSVTNGQSIVWNSTSNVWNARNVVLGLSGDGVNNTDPRFPSLTFPTVDQIGAYANTNPAGYQNVTQVVAYANVVSVNGKSGVVVLDVNDIGAYANTNPSGYQNVSQVVSYANVINVNGQSGIVSLALDNLTDVDAPTPTSGYVLTYNGTATAWKAEAAQGGTATVDMGQVILNSQVFS